eukprot:807632_1
MMKQKQWQIVPTFIFLSLCTHTSCSANWLCNQSLWTSNSSVDAWVFESNSNDNHNCSVVSPREYALSILWIGNHYNRNLNGLIEYLCSKNLKYDSDAANWHLVNKRID